MAFGVDLGNALLGDVFAPWVQALSLSVESVTSNGAVLLMPFSPSVCREGGTLCGQSLMAMADTSAVIAVCAASDGYRPMATVSQSIQLLKPVSNQAVKAQAVVTRLGKSMAFINVDISGVEDGKPVAMAQLNYALPPAR